MPYSRPAAVSNPVIPRVTSLSLSLGICKFHFQNRFGWHVRCDRGKNDCPNFVLKCFDPITRCIEQCHFGHCSS